MATAAVVDASALVDLLLQPGLYPDIDGRTAQLHIPGSCDSEVSAALRRLWVRRIPGVERVGSALDDYLQLPLIRHVDHRLLKASSAHWNNFGAYDAIYVSLALYLDAELITSDLRLASSAEELLGLTVIRPSAA